MELEEREEVIEQIKKDNLCKDQVELFQIVYKKIFENEIKGELNDKR